MVSHQFVLLTLFWFQLFNYYLLQSPTYHMRIWKYTKASG